MYLTELESDRSIKLEKIEAANLTSQSSSGLQDRTPLRGYELRAAFDTPVSNQSSCPLVSLLVIEIC